VEREDREVSQTHEEPGVIKKRAIGERRQTQTKSWNWPSEDGSKGEDRKEK